MVLVLVGGFNGAGWPVRMGLGGCACDSFDIADGVCSEVVEDWVLGIGVSGQIGAFSSSQVFHVFVDDEADEWEVGFLKFQEGDGDVLGLVVSSYSEEVEDSVVPG